METAAVVDIYTTVLGWTLYDRLWEALLDTGLAYLPFLAVFVRNFVKNWEDAGDGGAEASVRNLEVSLAAMFTVVVLAGQPVLDLPVAGLSHTAACGASAAAGGDTGTLYDGAFDIGGAGPAKLPVWWRAVMAVSAGMSNVAVAAIPCQANLRRLSYQMENTRIADPELRAQIGLFAARCFEPAKARFAREHRILPAGYAADDVDWPGSRFFLDTAGFYDDPNPALAPRPEEPVPGFPYDPARDLEYGGTAPASGLGRPTCKQWWSDGSAGLRKRLLDQIDPAVLAEMKNAATGAATPEAVEDAQIRRLFVNEAPVRAASTLGSNFLFAGLFATDLDQVVKGMPDPFKVLANLGTAYHAAEQTATFYALQQAAPIGQSLILMAIYLCLPFVLVFSSYSIETALLAALGIFALRFLTALWALATWVDAAMAKALGISWWTADGDQGVAALVVGITGALLFVGLPVVWFLVLGWAGHRLAASGLAGALTEGVGRAAAGGVRAGSAFLRGGMRGLRK